MTALPVLLIESDECVRNAWWERLQESYEVVCVNNLTEAMLHVQNTYFQGILVDTEAKFDSHDVDDALGIFLMAIRGGYRKSVYILGRNGTGPYLSDAFFSFTYCNKYFPRDANRITFS